METPPLVVPLRQKGPRYVTTVMGSDILSQPMNGDTKVIRMGKIHPIRRGYRRAYILARTPLGSQLEAGLCNTTEMCVWFVDKCAHIADFDQE